MSLAQNDFEMKRDEAAAARDAHFAEAKAIEPQIPPAEIALEKAKVIPVQTLGNKGGKIIF